ncbi:MAG: glycosyltransferase family 4 protein [Rhodothermales bacterium]
MKGNTAFGKVSKMEESAGTSRRLRIVIHDFAGHPFQVQLSRALAARGHEVCHAFCSSLMTTPHGALAPAPDDAETLTIRPLSLGEPLEKYDFVKRWRQERRYGRILASVVDEVRPDVVLSGNTPLDAQKQLLRKCRSRRIPLTHWAQDLIGLAATRLLVHKWHGFGDLIGSHYVRMERRILRRASAVVVISEDFVPTLVDWGVPEESIQVIENWAPLEEVPVRPRDNRWTNEHRLTDAFRFVYTGTLGLKHNPDLLLQLALSRPDISVLVVSQGMGADWLSDRKAEMIIPNLHILGFQPFDRLAEVLGAADVLVAILEPEADVFSVPSKVLTYLCAARPVLLAVPAGNLAARIVERIGCGVVVPPTDRDAFLDAAVKLVEDDRTREQMGPKARAYAEETFDIDRITSRFERVLASTLTSNEND